jgi:hypothetical protein
MCTPFLISTFGSNETGCCLCKPFSAICLPLSLKRILNSGGWLANKTSIEKKIRNTTNTRINLFIPYPPQKTLNRYNSLFIVQKSHKKDQ